MSARDDLERFAAANGITPDEVAPSCDSCGRPAEIGPDGKWRHVHVADEVFCSVFKGLL